RQREWWLHDGAFRDRGVFRRQSRAIAVGPDHHGAMGAQVRQVNPRRALWLAVDQGARMVARVMADIAAQPHAGDDIGERLSGGGAEAIGDLRREAIAGKHRGAVAMVDMRKHGILRYEYQSVE